MATTVSYNGTNYTVPQPGNSGWGTTLTTYLVALASGSLTKAGGLMTLTAELDLGANFGIRSIYFAGRSTPATAGLVRLGNTQAISWRNAANDANLDLLVNASNNLTWKNILKIQKTGSGFTALAHDTQGLELESTAMNATSKYCPPIKFMCADTDIVTNNPRCIAYIAARTTGTVNSDTTPTGVLEFATLPGGEAAATMPTVRATIDHNGNFGVANLAGSGSRLVRASAAAGNLSATAADIVNADISASAAIAYSKLNLATSIVNADISASAAIAYSKLAALTSANIIVGSAGNVATAVAVTGDITLSNAGVTAIASGVIVNDDISASAAIDGSKIVSASGSVAGVVTTGTQTFAGAKTFSSLAGTGTRIVTADTNGSLAASAIFQDSGEQNATLSWSSTAPSSAVYEKYRWYRIGNLVTLTISANYAIAGANNTTVHFEFPSGIPAPAIPTGANTTEYILPGFGYWHTADGNLTSASSKVGLYYASANTFRLFCVRASGSAAFATFGITYVTTGSDIP